MLKCKEIVVSGDVKRLSLKEEIWAELDKICQAEGLELPDLCTLIDEARGYCRLDAATSFFVLTYKHSRKQR